MHDSLSSARVLAYEDMRTARRQILAVKDPQAQDALFTLLGLLQQLAARLDSLSSTGVPT